jgi:Zn-dependent metalloprotease
LDPAIRRSLADTAAIDVQLRKVRAAGGHLNLVSSRTFGAAALAAAPAVLVYDCGHTTSLPGLPVARPEASADAAARRVFEETAAVADFFHDCFGRNSIDGRGMTLLSSIHYGTSYNNAFWNSRQMTYGDGDGRLFVDFTRSQDVIAHELMHGVTEFTADFDYADEPGGLNESMSDVFGSMFRQWRRGQDAASADWLIGADIVGPDAVARGYSCLRDLSDPSATHCLSRQPRHYSGYFPGMDPHDSSGIPNFAFYTAAMAIGGNSWERAGRVWYEALTTYGPSRTLGMKRFADRTRECAQRLFPNDMTVVSAIEGGWNAVGL